MFDYGYMLDGEPFSVERVYIDDDGAIIACGRYRDGIWDEARVEDLEIYRDGEKVN